MPIQILPNFETTNGLDEKDLKLLRLIARNAKKTLMELGNELELATPSVIYRIKQLEKNKVILGYRAIINFALLGYQYYKVDLFIEDMKKRKSLQEFARRHPNIIYEDRTVGGSDIEFDLEARDYDEFFKVIEDIKDKFPGLIRTYKYYKCRKIHKYAYVPEE